MLFSRTSTRAVSHAATVVTLRVAAVAVAGALCAGLVPAVASAAPDRIHPYNRAAECPDVLVVAASGATDSTSHRHPLDEDERRLWSNWVGNVTVPTGERFAHGPETVGWAYVPYPATFGLGVTETPTYQASVSAALAETHRILEDAKAACGDRTKFVLVGYSVGAEIMHRVTAGIGQRSSGGRAPGTTDSGTTPGEVTPDDVLGVVPGGWPVPTGRGALVG
ncbi:Cutinase [Rhodococcus triatomae]|uniref:Cutinase n=1 Tax=Rhodococcus triatomae TaxID=300028 RepID=A0A1G8B269_9NOCA|nr:cutinase family protein [Rhodococcus triatomae]SDH27352.1 Cutinase [Rhodococcus triatomae]